MQHDRHRLLSLTRHKRSLLALPAFALVLVAAVWAATLLQLESSRRTTLDAAMHDTETYVAAYERYTRHALHDADRTAMLVKREFERFGTLDMPGLIRARVVDPQGLDVVSIIDVAGNVVASSRPLSSAVNVADRDYFRVHSSRDLDQLDISEPIVSRVSGQTVILLTRRMNHADGSFAGVVLLAVAPDRFTDFYQESVLGKDGFIGVLGLDGFYRGRRVGQDAATAPDAHDTPLLASAQSSVAGSYEGASKLDRVTRLVAFRRLADYPLAVVAAQSIDEVLGDFYRMRSTYLCIATIATAVIVLFFYVLTVLAVRLQRHRSELKIQRRFLRVLVDNLPFGVAVRSMKFHNVGQYVLWSNANELLFGIDGKRALGQTIEDVLPADSARRIRSLDQQLLTSPMPQYFVEPYEIEGRGRRLIRSIHVPIFGASDEIESILAISNDVTEELLRTDQLRLASKVFETTADGIILTDSDDRVIVINAAFTKLTGYVEDEMLGKVLAETPFRPTDLADSDARMKILHRDGQVAGEVPRVHKNGTELSLWVTGTCIRDEAGKIVNYVRVFTDISPLKRTQQKLERLANFDALTGLPNRRLLQDRLEQALRRAERCAGGMGILFIDLDGFKRVNDTFGHATGDLLLREVAARLRTCMRASDSFCRMGGDEFAVVLEAAGPADARCVAERVVAALTEPFLISGQKLKSGASLGIALYPQDGNDTALLLRNADAAMYRAKSRGGSRFECYSAPTDEVRSAA